MSHTQTRIGRAPRVLATGLGLTAVLALAYPALADTTDVRDPVRDRIPTGPQAPGESDRVTAGHDIVSASAGHASDGRLMHVIRVKDAGPNTSPSTIFLDLKVGSARYYVAGWFGPRGTGSVIRQLKKYPYSKTTGTGEASRKGNEITFVFSRKAIGNAKSYRWRALANQAPHGEGAVVDWVPNKGYKLHDLRPAAKIIGGPPSATVARSASFAFTSKEEGSSFQCRLDRGRFEDCASPKLYEQLSLGEHVFAVRATKDGVVGKPAERTWQVVTVAPRLLEIPLRGDKAFYSVYCPPATSCEGTVTITRRGKTLATGKYSVPAGETRDVELKLTAAGRRAVKRGPVSAIATVVNTPTNTRVSTSVVLKRG